MSFKFKQKGLAGFLAKIQQTIAVTDRRVLNDIGTFATNRIQAFTRTGKSIVGESPAPLKPLSPSYKAFRQGKVTFWKNDDGKLIAAKFRSRRLREVDGTFFRPTKSNLTFTGKMIKSLSFKVDTASTSVLIKPTGDRNVKVAGFVSDQGRPWVGIDSKGRERIVNILRQAIRKRLRLTT